MRIVECDECKYQMLVREWEEFPECPFCGCHYVTEKTVHRRDKQVHIKLLEV